jgi:hypothetical protein
MRSVVNLLLWSPPAAAIWALSSEPNVMSSILGMGDGASIICGTDGGGEMLKMSGGGMRDGKPVRLVVLGLSHENLRRLKAGNPIRFDGEDVGLADAEVLIFSGLDERTMAREVADLVGPQTQTQTKIDPRLRD